MARKHKAKSTRRVKKNSSLAVAKKTKLLRGIMITGIVLAIVLVLLLLANAGVFEGPREEFHVSITDECSVVMGNLIHQIRNEGDCTVKCINDCEVREAEFSRMTFTAQNNSCHLCECYCK